ncbi:Lnb N-terminal periplasmic domain-containing protein [Flavobacterium selenitireducens]|uniref:Lnb N-terminal periplasmic domain-containing protein n=1 Tax=Flavobacterium selenitireducens TaxID=2722704 RepID=UPI00168B2340|nr:DUF4105 domain-containing protein [Flavobacterium selenitireducens]MBD3583421.1 DUF4105 domain-containing protein [Flavobacterium selenitireducens]
MRSFFAFFLLLFTGLLSAQFTTLSNHAEISILTCGNGNELYSLFGHTALRVDDPANGIDKVYNYGSFDFATPNFALKFAKGDLQYFVSTSSFEDFLYNYDQEKRSVFEQRLNLTAAQKQKVFDHLNKVLVSQERFYQYKFIDRNCTTKVADILNDVVGANTIRKIGNKDMTYREVIYPEFDGYFYEQWGTSVIFGTRVDDDATQLFLPIELYQSISEARNGDQKLLESNKSWLVFEEAPPAKSVWNNVYTYIAILMLIVFANNDKLTLVYFTVIGLLGIFFCVAGWYSFHTELQWNYNALLLNPLLLLVPINYGRRKARTLYIICLLCLGCLGAYLIYMLNKIHLLIVAPMIVAHAVLLLKFMLRSRRKTLFAS